MPSEIHIIINKVYETVFQNDACHHLWYCYLHHTLMVLFFVISLVGMIASDSASTKVKENSVFVIKMDGTISERAEEGTPFDALLGMGDMSAMGLDDLIASIRKAKDNEDIKGIYLEGGTTSFDAPATAQQLRDVLKEFKQSGKWIVAYADQYMQASYYVASVADNIYLNNHGMIDFKGLGGKGHCTTNSASNIRLPK